MYTKHSVSYKNTGYFSKLICDYLDENDKVKEFYNNFPNIDGFKKQIEERIAMKNSVDRDSLAKTLIKQYKKVTSTKSTLANIELLEKENTFTITTGHQLNLFTGPLYFLFKIISTINLCKQLEIEFPKYNFVPIYWMATEDHDFEEIQYFNFHGRKMLWDKDSKGAVGRQDTKGLDLVFDKFSRELGNSENAEIIKSLFKKSYFNQDNLSDATRCLANDLFGAYGLVILDADDRDLKKNFAPYAKKELIDQVCHTKVSKTIKTLEQNYKVQVNPREINLFYLDENLRERIIFEEGIYRVNNTSLTFTQDDILAEIDKSPEKFSPNVLMRPLYQEVILPNLCYIGGGGELAYWLELKNYFKGVDVVFPILLIRNSALIYTKKQIKKMSKLNISNEGIFSEQQELINKKIKEISELDIDFSPQRKELKKMFKEFEILSNETDKSFLGAVKAQEKKQINGIDKLEKRLLKAQKRKLGEVVERIKILQDQIFPNGSLQERQINFCAPYLDYGELLIPTLFRAFKPLELEFDLITI